MGQVESKLKKTGIELPTPVAPVAVYVPYVRTGNLVFVSGQTPMGPDGCVTGHLTGKNHMPDGKPTPGSELERAIGAAQLCGINVLAQVKAAIGDLDRVTRVVKLTGFVNADGSFTQQSQVINGASKLMVDAFGEKGEHSRSAVGSGGLPLGAICEVEGIFEVE